MSQALAIHGIQRSDEWYTPLELIRALGDFDLDPACGPGCRNRTARRRYGPEEDGLQQAWHGRVWLNPPFSNAKPFIERLAQHGNGIALVFVRADARWWQEAVRRAGCVFLFLGRLQFERPESGGGEMPYGLLPDPIRGEEPKRDRAGGTARGVAGCDITDGRWQMADGRAGFARAGVCTRDDERKEVRA